MVSECLGVWVVSDGSDCVCRCREGERDVYEYTHTHTSTRTHTSCMREYVHECVYVVVNIWMNE